MEKKIALLKPFKDRSGSALIFVLLLLLISTIFTATVLNIFSGNLKQTKHQEHYIEAYYLAYSGIQMAFTALNADDNELFNNIKNDTVESLVEDNIAFGNGIIDILVTKSSDTNYDGWIKITATATLSSSNVSRTRTLYVDSSNQKNVVWKEH